MLSTGRQEGGGRGSRLLTDRVFFTRTEAAAAQDCIAGAERQATAQDPWGPLPVPCILLPAPDYQLPSKRLHTWQSLEWKGRVSFYPLPPQIQ